MAGRIYNWFRIRYPQNFIIKHPFAGTLLIALFVFVFAVIYKPFNAHAAKALDFDATMAVYSFLSGFFIFLSIKILKAIRFFSDSAEWNTFKELLSVFIVLLSLGIGIYLLGFIIEPSAYRLNISTFLNSLKGAFLTGIIPLFFFTASNYRYLLAESTDQNDVNVGGQRTENQPPEDLIQISSQLKKEELNFYPNQFLYAESEGNYVVFYLSINNQVKKEIIRNSINNIEQQLSEIPYILRIHRAFIVNLKKVRSRQGNTLGYLIKLTESEFKIPVSRKNTKVFNNLLALYNN
ncbi:MAG: LytTR family DNA-binding domain-containing protein [Bacteroidales bacterium]